MTEQELRLHNYKQYYDNAIKQLVQNKKLRKQLDRDIAQNEFAAAYWLGRVKEMEQHEVQAS